MRSRTSRVISMILALVFFGTVLLGDVSQVLAQHDDVIQVPAPFIYMKSVEFNKGYLVPKVEHGMTAAKNLPKTVVNTAKTVGPKLSAVPKAAGKVPGRVKTWYNKTTTVPKGEQGMSYTQRLRSRMGKGVQRLGKAIEPKKPTAAAKAAAAAKGISTASQNQAMKTLGITKDARGGYHMKGRRGAISKVEANKLINKQAAKNPVGKVAAIKGKVGTGVSNFKANLKKGYATGKTNAGGVVKQTLDFRGKAAWRNVGLAAGLVIGVNTLRAIAKGEPLTFQNTIGSVLRREFAGAYIGGALGCAAGSLAQGLLGAVPVVGPIVGAFMPALGGVMGAHLGGNLAAGTRQGKFSFGDALAQIDPVEVGGQAVGSTIGAIIGSAICPGVGTVIGGMVGAFVGGAAANWIGENVFGRKKGGSNAWLYSGKSGSRQQDISKEKEVTENKDVTAREASKAYQDYIAAYNKLTDLMSRGLGDTPEAQQAYRDYKSAKENYEQIAQSVKK